VPASDPRRQVPRTDVVLADPRLVEAAARIGDAAVKRAVVQSQQRARDGVIGMHDVAEDAAARLPPAATGLQPVVNATGVVLHTNLGRARLSDAALGAVRLAAGYVDVEFDLDGGRRAPRGRGALDALRRRVPEAGDVLVVNNGAAALLLAATALGAGRELIISRGELVEIGDGFRLPDLIESGGARIREVGTTNRVTARDYADAVGPDTAGIVKIHPGNFRIEGFTSAVPTGALAALGVPVIADVGSGLLDPDPLLPAEPDVRSALRAGAALVTCSGDKLLGGPQAGLILGTGDLVGRLRRHPMARALRIDKLAVAALEATLDGPRTPTDTYLHAEAGRLRERCELIAAQLDPLVVGVVASAGAVGGGGGPGVVLPGWALSLPASCAAALRAGRPAVLARVEHDRCLVDLRCVDPEEDGVLMAAIGRALSR
jgi:L-seryl-tRNA(Ser) seleniumtransferase